MTSLALFYKVRPIAQRGLYLLGLFCRFILKVDGFQHPQAAFYIVPLSRVSPSLTLYNYALIRALEIEKEQELQSSNQYARTYVSTSFIL